MNDVLCIPSFKYKLLSVSEMVSTKRLAFNFLNNLCVFRELHTWKTIGLAKKRDELSFLKSERDNASSLARPTIAVVESSHN